MLGSLIMAKLFVRLQKSRLNRTDPSHYLTLALPMLTMKIVVTNGYEK